jgi:hypothetical protein
MQPMRFLNKETGEVVCRICGQTNVIKAVVRPSGLRYRQGSAGAATNFADAERT